MLEPRVEQAPPSSPSLPLHSCAEVSGSARWAVAAPAAPREPVVHIAERFRLAYVSRQERLKARQERQERQWQRREERERSGSQAERLIQQWEEDL